jgi:HEPN domain-containing protein
MQSDYKDFYIATKQDAEKQIQNAEKFLEMVKDYLSKQE